MVVAETWFLCGEIKFKFEAQGTRATLETRGCGRKSKLLLLQGVLLLLQWVLWLLLPPLTRSLSPSFK